jgi:FkbM family methyltransferase
VFDVGASIGEWSALAATIVAAEKIHVFEQDLGSWRHIEKIFRLNSLRLPGGILEGFVSDRERGLESLSRQFTRRAWPHPSSESAEFKDLTRDHEVPSITIDTYCRLADITPTVFKIDVEGAEGLVLRAATKLLREGKPKIFLSLHPTEVGKFGDEASNILNLIDSHGYTRTLLGTDHEEHWYCKPS